MFLAIADSSIPTYNGKNIHLEIQVKSNFYQYENNILKFWVEDPL